MQTAPDSLESGAVGYSASPALSRFSWHLSQPPLAEPLAVVSEAPRLVHHGVAAGVPPAVFGLGHPVAVSLEAVVGGLEGLVRAVAFMPLHVVDEGHGGEGRVERGDEAAPPFGERVRPDAVVDLRQAAHRVPGQDFPVLQFVLSRQFAEPPDFLELVHPPPLLDCDSGVDVEISRRAVPAEVDFHVHGAGGGDFKGHLQDERRQPGLPDPCARVLRPPPGGAGEGRPLRGVRPWDGRLHDHAPRQLVGLGEPLGGDVYLERLHAAGGDHGGRSAAKSSRFRRDGHIAEAGALGCVQIERGWEVAVRAVFHIVDADSSAVAVPAGRRVGAVIGVAVPDFEHGVRAGHPVPTDRDAMERRRLEADRKPPPLTSQGHPGFPQAKARLHGQHQGRTAMRNHGIHSAGQAPPGTPRDGDE